MLHVLLKRNLSCFRPYHSFAQKLEKVFDDLKILVVKVLENILWPFIRTISPMRGHNVCFWRNTIQSTIISNIKMK